MAFARSLRLAVMAVEQEGETLKLNPRRLPAIADALEADLEGPDAERAVDGLLRLMHVLRRRNAVAAADALGWVLRRFPAAMKQVQSKSTTKSSIDAARNFAEREGRSLPVRAPLSEPAQSPGGLRAKAFIYPGGADRARALSRARKEAKHAQT